MDISIKQKQQLSTYSPFNISTTSPTDKYIPPFLSQKQQNQLNTYNNISKDVVIELTSSKNESPNQSNNESSYRWCIIS